MVGEDLLLCTGIAGLEHAIDLSTSSGEADSENTGSESDSDEVSIADLVGNFSDGLKLEHAFPVFYNDLHDTGGELRDAMANLAVLFAAVPKLPPPNHQ